MEMRHEHQDGAPGSKRMMRPAWRGLPLCALGALLAIGCATEDGDWAKAQASGTVEAYETFLGARPSSRYAEQAVDKIWDLTANNRGSKIADFEAFLARHGSSPRAQAALEQVWQLTTKDNTIQGLEAFLGRHPSSAHAQEAVGAIWLLTASSNTLDGYDAFAAKHARDPLAEKAKAASQQLWAASKPAKPDCPLTSELRVDVSWEPMQQAQSYVLYWSSSSSNQRNRKSAEATTGTAFTHTSRVGEYGARLPMFYRVAAVRNGAESGLSDACVARLLSDNDGTRCQICGQKSIGYCHLREIYVCENHNTFTADSGTNWQCP
jgi:hypothetical protein